MAAYVDSLFCQTTFISTQTPPNKSQLLRPNDVDRYSAEVYLHYGEV